MPITAVTYQPNENSINAAYTPIIYRCKATIPSATSQNYVCPVVYCDIYIGGIYYKSLSRSQYIKNDGSAPEYEFDIQDAIQELMDYNLPRLGGNVIEEFTNTIKTVFVKFRNAFIDANGFSISEQVAPIQGTSSSAPSEGGGIKSKQIYVLNSVIQHEEKQNLEELLESYKTGTWANAYPITKRPKLFKLCKQDSSHFPIITSVRPQEICIKAKLKSGVIVDLCEEIIIDCPQVYNITYSVVDNGDGTQTFTFNWDLPVDMSGITGLNIYSSEDPSNGWYFENGSFTPPRTMTLYLGKYDFRFGLVGSCAMGETIDLPGIDQIGIVESDDDNPPTVLIRWDDNQGQEDRVCTNSVCNFIVEVYATDPDNDIVNIQILKKVNNGNWNVLISNLQVNIFNDSINTTGTQQYKAIVIDANNNQAESNILSYAKQQDLNALYRKVITGITCVNIGGDGPTNYDVWCTGYNDFALSDSNMMNILSGYVRMTVDGGTAEIGLSKSGGGALILNEVLPITTLITASYASVGQNPPSAYPWGYPANLPPVIYTFEYSLNGTSGWTSFDLSVDD